jgi:DNA-binding response OmpR family regulator
MHDASETLASKLLIADHDPASVRILERILKEAGFTSVASTLDPHLVGELHRRNRYDLILLDLQMSGMDGFQVLEGLKVLEKDGYLSVLATSAHPPHRERALKAGARGFLGRPFDAAEVLARVQDVLELHRLHTRNTTKRRRRQSISKSPTTGRWSLATRATRSR